MFILSLSENLLNREVQKLRIGSKRQPTVDYTNPGTSIDGGPSALKLGQQIACVSNSFAKEAKLWQGLLTLPPRYPGDRHDGKKRTEHLLRFWYAL
jgi:hypothetical protein